MVAAFIAITVARLTAVNTFLKPPEKAIIHHQIGSDFNALKDDARRLRTVHVRTASTTTLAQRLDRLGARKAERNRSAPQLLARAYQQAKHGVARGEASYAVDKQGE